MIAENTEPDVRSVGLIQRVDAVVIAFNPAHDGMEVWMKLIEQARAEGSIGRR